MSRVATAAPAASEFLKVRMRSSRADERTLYKVGMAYTFPRKFAERLLEEGEAIEFIEGEPDYIPPEGLDRQLPPVERSGTPAPLPKPKR